jgi:ATP-dependent RNA helicase DDX19/DBP5
MTAEGHKVASLHGAKDASERDAIIDRFREGKEKVRHFTITAVITDGRLCALVQVLITTNVIARGIDIMQVNMVVNYDLPLLNERVKGADERPDVETYIHRIGTPPLLSAFLVKD